MAFQPFSVRRGSRQPFELVDGVPDHIKAPLADWLQEFTSHPYRGANSDELDLLIARLQWPIVERDPSRRHNAVYRYIGGDDEAFLDALDLVCQVSREDRRKKLDRILESGLSVFRVRGYEPYGLEERLGEESRAAISRAASAADAAGEHIADAWSYAYGRETNATAAWNSAVKAIEFLLQPIVEPNSRTARLGTMLPALRAKPEKWEFAVSGGGGDVSATPFLRAMEIITYEPGRHGTDPARATIEQARVVVLQAVTIVEWLRAGALVLLTS